MFLSPLRQVGGKNVHSGMVATVSAFARDLVAKAAERDMGFGRHLAYFDQNYESAEK